MDDYICSFIFVVLSLMGNLILSVCTEIWYYNVTSGDGIGENESSLYRKHDFPLSCLLFCLSTWDFPIHKRFDLMLLD